MKFSSITLRLILAKLPPAAHWWVAYSGGMDSHCLLHALVGLVVELPPIGVIHVNHGMNPAALRWSQHCAAVCEALRVPYHLVPVSVTPAPGESVEAAARHARYTALAQLMAPGDILLTAHHQDDQAETILLQLLRGAGLRGLAAMPFLAPFHNGYLARPLLDYPQVELRIYAQTTGLSWIEDDSNFEQRYDRNYLRHQIMPILVSRWPAAVATLARTAHHQAEAAVLLESLAAQDLPQIVGPQPNTLRVAPLLTLDAARARNLLRWWIRGCGHETPTAAMLARILDEVAAARGDAAPLLAWNGTELRRYRGLLYLMTALSPLPPFGWEVAWQDLAIPLYLPWGVLSARPLIGVRRLGLVYAQEITVRLRRGGERCRLAGKLHHRPLKNLWQDAGTPPWERIRTPLLFSAGTLAVVPGFGVCNNFQTCVGELGWEIVWNLNTGSHGAGAGTDAEVNGILASG